MSFDLRSAAVTFLTAALRALAAGDNIAVAPVEAPPDALTAGHLVSLGGLLRYLPVADLIAIVTGRATWDTALDAAERAADLVRAAFPPAAMTATEVKLGLEALQFLLDAAGVGPNPFKIQGGVPGAFPPGGGPGPYRGR